MCRSVPSFVPLLTFRLLRCACDSSGFYQPTSALYLPLPPSITALRDLRVLYVVAAFCASLFRFHDTLTSYTDHELPCSVQQTLWLAAHGILARAFGAEIPRRSVRPASCPFSYPPQIRILLTLSSLCTATCQTTPSLENSRACKDLQTYNRSISQTTASPASSLQTPSLPARSSLKCTSLSLFFILFNSNGLRRD